MKAEIHTTAPEPYPVNKLTDTLDKAFYSTGKHDPEKPVHMAYRHHFAKPGGGFRAKFAYQSALHLGIGEDDAIILAATVECLHNASLVLDDVQDGSPLRRGQASVYSAFGAATAQGLTNCLVTASFACLSEFSESRLLPSLIQKVHQAVAETVHGQTDELVNPAGEDLNRHLHASMLKSGPLFSLAIELPLIAAEAVEHLEDASHASYCFGLAYQIVDDLTDCEQDASSHTHGNIALRLQAKPGQSSANSMAVRLAHSLLKQTQHYSVKLPDSSGWPLLEMATQLYLKIDRSYA